jgi:hypothetical protein
MGMSNPLPGHDRIDELRSFKSGALSDANLHLVRRARDPIGKEREWDFFCECGEESCYEHVFLTLAAFTALRDHGDPVLAFGHHVSQVDRARGLRLEAEALGRQAEHQVNRAKRNLADRPGA